MTEREISVRYGVWFRDHSFLLISRGPTMTHIGGVVLGAAADRSGRKSVDRLGAD